jgi:hypothetical protein
MHSDRVDAGVVAKDVDIAERFGDGRERGLALRLVADVGSGRTASR